jgi:NADPH2 dehydrogenase
LIISEATFISAAAGGYDNAPGIWSQEQVAAWNKVIDRIHAKGSKFYLQLWALGSAAKPEVLERDGYSVVSASEVTGEFKAKPRALTKDEIKDYISTYVAAAKNAIAAGADGVEIHNANGYLLDQFLREATNKRTDEYGGSIENRARFPFEVIDAVTAAIGADKVGIRLSPWRKTDHIGVGFDVSPIPQFSYVVSELERRRLDGKGLAYIHVVEPRMAPGNFERDDIEEGYSNRLIFDIWKGPVIRAGGLIDSAKVAAEENDRTLVAFGRYFIANPDLPYRLENGLELTKYDRSTFYSQGVEGYTTYEYSEEFKTRETL